MTFLQDFCGIQLPKKEYSFALLIKHQCVYSLCPKTDWGIQVFFRSFYVQCWLQTDIHPVVCCIYTNGKGLGSSVFIGCCVIVVFKYIVTNLICFKVSSCLLKLSVCLNCFLYQSAEISRARCNHIDFPKDNPMVSFTECVNAFIKKINLFI